MVIEDIGVHNADDDNTNTMSLNEELEQKEKEKKAKKEAKDSDKVKSSDEEKKNLDTSVDPIVKLIAPSLQTTDKSSESASTTLAPTSTVTKKAADELKEIKVAVTTPDPSLSTSPNVFTTLLPSNLDFRSADSNATVLAKPATVDSVSLSNVEVPSTSSANPISVTTEKSDVEAKNTSTLNSVNTTKTESTTTTSTSSAAATNPDSVSHSTPVQPKEESETELITNGPTVDSSETEMLSEQNTFKEVPVKRTENANNLSENELESTLSDLSSNLTELINESNLPNVENKVIPVSEAEISEIKDVLEQFNNILNQKNSPVELGSDGSEGSVDKNESKDTLTTPMPSPLTISSSFSSNLSSENVSPSFEDPVILNDETTESLVKLKNKTDVKPQASEVENNKSDQVPKGIAESDKHIKPSEVTEMLTSDSKEAKKENMSSTAEATTVSVVEKKKVTNKTESGLKFDGFNFVCLFDGMFKHPTECTKFVFCASGSPMLLSCPLGLGWNSKHSTCDILKHSEC